MSLSKRMEHLIGLVPKGYRLADVGCDHGFVSIALIERGICTSVIASDVGKGPLSRAIQHIEEKGLQDRIQTRLSSGLDHLQEDEVDGCLIAGMGGPLMQDILQENLHKAKKMQFLVLQPQSEIPQFRYYLIQQGFMILRNEVLQEDGKYYFPMLVAPVTSELITDVIKKTLEEDYILKDSLQGDVNLEIPYRYGMDLVREDRGLADYLEAEGEKLRDLLCSLEGLTDKPMDRIERIRLELASNQEAERQMWEYRK